VLLATRDEGVRRVVFSSCTSVYGTSRERPTKETSPPDPISPYGAAVIPLFVTAIAAGRPITVHGDGKQSRDFTYVGNVVDATILAADAPGANGRIFNAAAGSPATVNELADTIGRLLDKPVEREFAPPRPGDIRDSWADLTAARETLGYEPTVGLEDGLRRTAECLLG
jgi:UDP-N-acetylglucosamine/UDP-N-acetyl-alpha-D-glucosaminouronate 4-epimerase